MSVATNALLSEVAAMRAERERASRALGPIHAPDFNSVRLLWPDENDLSRIFAWMLDQRESHGQGTRFLKLFFEMVLGDDDYAKRDWRDMAPVCEAWTLDRNGRIDILLASRCGGMLAIENKPWAEWQDDQLGRYHDDQQRRGGVARTHALIGGTMDPSAELLRHWKTECIAGKAGHPLPDAITACGYDVIVAWIEACAAASRPESVRRFLFDLANHCRTTILREPPMSETTDLARQIASSSPDRIAAAKAIEAAARELPAALSEALAERLAAALPEARIATISEKPGGKPCGVEVVSQETKISLFLFIHQPWIGFREQAHAASLFGPAPWKPAYQEWQVWDYIRDMTQPEIKALCVAIDANDLSALTGAIAGLAKTGVKPLPLS